MSKRLQVILDDEELAEIRAVARRHRVTVAEWVRQSLRRARQDEPRVPADEKLRAIASAAEHRFPAGDIESMLGEIESGYLGEGLR